MTAIAWSSAIKPLTLLRCVNLTSLHLTAKRSGKAARWERTIGGTARFPNHYNARGLKDQDGGGESSCLKTRAEHPKIAIAISSCRVALPAQWYIRRLFARW